MATTGKAFENVFTVVIGGAAGDGVREAGSNLGELLAKLGYEIFYEIDYPSLIRGGHNFARVSFAKEPVKTSYTGIDVLVALDENTMKQHKDELNSGAVILAENFDEEDKKTFGENAVAVPFNAFAKEAGAPPITRTSAALGAVCYLLNLPYDLMVEDLKKVFKDKSLDANLALAERGYEHLKGLNFRHSKPLQHEGEKTCDFVDGNGAFARGLLAAGLEFYVAYPMTPSSSILHYLAKVQRDAGIKVVQPENEIGVINMALGVSYAGKRVAIGTAGGGFALMQEAYSLAALAELPLVIGVSQRFAPATGVPTYTSQGDLLWVARSGHGEFPRFVIAPGDADEAFRAGADALNIAWCYQTPVVVLLDKHLSENMMMAELKKDGVERDIGRHDGTGPDYKRYRQMENGVSPLAFPGAPGTVVRATSYEHDEDGESTEKPAEIIAMHDKRYRKLSTFTGERHKYLPSVKVSGDAGSDAVVVFWGSTKGAVLEAMKYVEKPVKLVQIVWVEPFDHERVAAELGGKRVVVAVEANREGQMAQLIRQHTGIGVQRFIGKYDGRPFDPLKLAEEIEKAVS